MIRRIVSFSLLAAFPLLAHADPAADYAENCASCHGADRLGGTGPALIPESLGRLKGAKLEAVIDQGRAMTQMPSFHTTLSAADITAVAAYISEPLATAPVWGQAEVMDSRDLLDIVDAKDIPDEPEVIYVTPEPTSLPTAAPVPSTREATSKGSGGVAAGIMGLLLAAAGGALWYFKQKKGKKRPPVQEYDFDSDEEEETSKEDE